MVVLNYLKQFFGFKSFVCICVATFLYSFFVLIGYIFDLESIIAPTQSFGLLTVLVFGIPLTIIFPKIDSIITGEVLKALLFWFSAMPWVVLSGIYGSQDQVIKNIGKLLIGFFIFYLLACATLTELFLFYMEGSVLDN